MGNRRYIWKIRMFYSFLGQLYFVFFDHTQLCSELLLALHLGNSWNEQELWDAEDQALVSHLQGKHHTCCTITPAPYFSVFYVFVIHIN